MAAIPYDIITKEEWDDKQRRESFYKMLFYLVFSLLNTKVDTVVADWRKRNGRFVPPLCLPHSYRGRDEGLQKGLQKQSIIARNLITMGYMRGTASS